MPKVSIIVPIYNVEKYLKRCMSSLLNQTLKDIEIILVDDESPDGCPLLCDEYAKKDARVKVIHKKNEGLGFARNSGLEIATGDFVAFVDSDDYVDLEMYETLYNQAKKFDLDTTFSNFKRVDAKNKISDVCEVCSFKLFEGAESIMAFLLNMIGTDASEAVDRKYQMSVWRAIYSLDVIEKNHIRFCSERQFISEDIIFHIDYLQKVDRVGYLPNAFYYYCANGSSLSLSYRSQRYLKNKELIIEMKRKLFDLTIENKNERIDRLFIGYTRSLLLAIDGYKLSMSEKMLLIKEICNDDIWQDIEKKYPYNKLPLKYRFILTSIFNKRVYTIYLVSLVKNSRNH